MTAKKPRKFTANTKAPAGSYAITKTVGGKTVKSYPVNTISRARNAVSRVGQHGTASDKAKVYAKVKSTYPALAKRSSVIKTPKTNGRKGKR